MKLTVSGIFENPTIISIEWIGRMDFHGENENEFNVRAGVGTPW